MTRDDRRRNRVGRVAFTLDRALGEGQDLSTSLFVEPKMLQRSERNRFRDFTRYHLGGSATWQLRRRLSETLESRTSERGATRLDDQTSEASMERRKREGYF